MSTKVGSLLLAVVGGLLLVGPAHAHAGYLRSVPGDGAVVASSPARVDIWFTQELFRRAGENWIRVFGPGERPAHSGEAQIDDDDRRHMWVALESGLEPGRYRVDWRTLSAEDGDSDEGSFQFTLDPQAEATSTPMAAGTAIPGPTRSAALASAIAAGTEGSTPIPTLASRPPSALPAPARSPCGLSLTAVMVLMGLVGLRRMRS